MACTDPRSMWGRNFFSGALWDDSDKRFCGELDSLGVRKDITKSAAS
jgi:hypothetical protein